MTENSTAAGSGPGNPISDYKNLYRLLAENASDVIWLLDAEGHFTYVSPSVEKLRGYTPQEVMQQSVEEVLTPASLLVMQNAVASAMSKIEQGATYLEPVAHELEQPCKDGSTVWTEAVVKALFDEHGKLNGYLGISRDITARRQAEMALRESEERYRLLVEMSPNGIGMISLDGHILIANRGAAAMLGYASPADIAGMSLFDIFAPEERERARERFSLALQLGEIREVEYAMYRRDGERFIGSISATLLRGADGEPRAWIGLLRDITARKQAEAALARAMEEKTALLREMQHRVMNGLTLITSLIRLEESQASATETRSVLLDLQNRVASLAGLYSILYQTGKVYDVRLDEYLRRIVQNLAQSYIYVDRAGEAPIQIEQHYDAITVEARNATALGLILNELMTNTMKYAFPGGKSGTVWIELKKSEAGIALCVSHNGAGLPPGFDRNQSSGFGMQLVSLLAEQIGGKFTFEQAAPGGADQEHPATVFCVQAPPDIISLQDL